jgi:hypothetical protein
MRGQIPFVEVVDRPNARQRARRARVPRLGAEAVTFSVGRRTRRNELAWAICDGPTAEVP